MAHIEDALADMRDGPDDADWREGAYRNMRALSPDARDMIRWIDAADVQALVLSGRLAPAGLNVLALGAPLVGPFAWREILSSAAVAGFGDPNSRVLSNLLKSDGAVTAATSDLDGRLDVDGLRHTLLNIGGSLAVLIAAVSAAAREAERLKLEAAQESELRQRTSLTLDELRRDVTEVLDDFGVPGGAGTLADRLQAALHRPPSHDRGGREYLAAERSFTGSDHDPAPDRR